MVLLDLRSPKLSGLEVLKAIRASTELHTMPVVVLTTSTAERDVVHAYEHRVNSYLVKPVDYAPVFTINARSRILLAQLGIIIQGRNSERSYSGKRSQAAYRR